MHSKLRTNFTFFRLGQCAGSAAPQCPHGSMCRVRCSLRVSVSDQLLLMAPQGHCAGSAAPQGQCAGSAAPQGQCAGSAAPQGHVPGQLLLTG